MSENAVAKSDAAVPAPPPDEENEALIDAEKTFKITVLGSILFGLAALLALGREWRGEASRGDDITLVVVRRL